MDEVDSSHQVHRRLRSRRSNSSTASSGKKLPQNQVDSHLLERSKITSKAGQADATVGTTDQRACAGEPEVVDSHANGSLLRCRAWRTRGSRAVPHFQRTNGSGFRSIWMNSWPAHRLPAAGGDRRFCGMSLRRRSRAEALPLKRPISPLTYSERAGISTHRMVPLYASQRETFGNAYRRHTLPAWVEIFGLSCRSGAISQYSISPASPPTRLSRHPTKRPAGHPPQRYSAERGPGLPQRLEF